MRLASKCHVLGYEEAIFGFWRLGIAVGGFFESGQGGRGNAGLCMIYMVDCLCVKGLFKFIQVIHEYS